ncbi:MAG TPA: hypothetical protein VNJ46_03555 [Gaiellaceae bacterium]|nr:hypothetical protein [Gaiellaceae bacterium]
MGYVARLLRAVLLLGVAATLVGVPLASSVNPDIDGFELDGNAAGGGRSDWDALGSPLEFTGFIADPTDRSDRGFTTGGSKDTNDISQWRWVDGQVTPAKDDIAHAYAAVYAEDSNLILYFGQNRVPEQRGDANVGFWFLQNPVGLNADGTFSGTHADGDLLVQSEFTNGGVVSGVHIFKWQGGALQLVSNQAQCAGGKLGTADACAIVNTGAVSTSWAGSIPAPYFFEGGINLTAVFGQNVPCFSTFLTNTRTSQSESAQLKDFTLGEIDTCGSIVIRKEATPSDGTQFGYTATGLDPSSFSLAAGGSQTYSKLQPGSYSVAENAPPAGWAFDSLSCSTSGPGTSASISGATASITLGFLGHVECTYVNKRKPQVRVVKALEPSSDPGRFDLQINGVTHADDVGDGGSTGFKEVDPGTVSVGELAGAGTDLASYVSSVACDSGKGSASGTSHSFAVGFGDQVTCTITNRRKPEVKVVKAVEPATDPGRFDLLVNGEVKREDAANGQDTGFVQVAAGAVTVGEAAGSGTSLSDYVSKVACDSGKGSTDPGTSHAFSVDYGDRVTCTITNTRKARLTVIKHVVNDNGGTKSASDFAISVSGSAPSPASFQGAESPGTQVAIGPGSYSVTETVDPDYDVTYSAGCSGTIAAGGSATCTITNDDRPPKLTLVKVVVNDNGGTAQPSAWTLRASGPTGFSGAGPSVSSGASFDAGSYDLSESGPAGYEASDWECSDGQADADTVNVGLGEEITCTITNDDRPATLVVVKTVVNDNGGTAVSSDWTMNVAGPTPLSFPGAPAPGTSSQVDAGAYKVTESGGPAGYALTYSGDCDADGDVTLAVGETKTCVLANDDQPATLTVVKHVVNDNGGGADAGDFTMTINGVTAAGGNSFPGSESGVTRTITTFGEYSVTESSVEGYEQVSASEGCAGTIALGQHKTCTITNDDRPPKLTLVKVVVNDNGGTAAPSAWTLRASGPTGFSGAGPSVSSGAGFDAGSYDLSESGPAGYEASDWECSDGQADADTVNVGLGEEITCTITNDDRAPKLTLVKVVVNDNGGTAQPSAWTLQASGPTGFSGAGPSVSSGASFDAGSYDLSESGPAGYEASAWVCSKGQADADTVNVGLGDEITCSITNDDLAPKLTLVKVVVNDDGGSALPSDWTLSADGPTDLSGQGPTVVSGPGFDAGSYDLSESGGKPGYLASAWACDEGQVDGDTVEVGLGDEITCRITNDDQPARLIVRKVVVNDNGGAKQAQDFSFQVNGGSAQAFEADGENELVVPAGIYDVSEPAVAGYSTSYQGCSNIVLPLGGSATCTITNNDVPRGQGSIDVQKSADPTSVKEPGAPVTFSVTITNTSLDVDITVTNVVDSVFGDLDDDGGNGCFDVPINMAPGAKATCTFQREITGAPGSTHRNVVTVSGRDENGNSLSDSDDATVDITPRVIDLVIVKEATSPTPLNGTVTYTLTVSNRGPDPATNVQVADPAPAGITYLSASPSQGTCAVSASLVTCSLGTLNAGQTVTITIVARATAVGTHTNTATATGGGGREANAADNVDSAVTVVPAPLRPPAAKPAPKPAPEVCLTLTVSPKMVKADGKPDRVRVVVTAGKKRVKGVRVLLIGPGVRTSALSDRSGVAILRINPRRPGLITITAVERNQRVCGPRRIGVVGVFLPPLTG